MIAQSPYDTVEEMPLAGVRVLDFGQYIAGPLAAMLLADQGAEVVHVVRPNGKGGMGDLDAVLQRNKSRIVLDLKTDAGIAEARKLVAGADILIENFRPGVMQKLGLGFDICRSLNPELIYLSMPGFASTDKEYASVPGWEGILGASTGLFTNISFSRNFLGLPPVYTSLPLPSVYGATHGAIAVVMALVARKRSGQGDCIEVPLASAFLSAMGANILSYDGQPERYDLLPRAFTTMVLPELKASFKQKGEEGVSEALKFAAKLIPPMMRTYECADGRHVYVFAMDHRRMSLRLLKELGIYEQFAEKLIERDPYLPESVSNNLSDVGTLGSDLRQEIRMAMPEAFQKRSALEWEKRLSSAGVPCAVHRTTEEWLAEPEVTTSGIAIRVVDPVFGEMTQPGPAVWVDGNPLKALSPSPRAISSGQIPVWERRESISAAKSKPDGARGCLAGIRVLDLTTMIAGPSCGRTLAEYGAEVLKVDSVAPYLGPRMVLWYAAELNQGKRSILLDLKKPEGREAFLRLVEQSDIVLHNMRPGVMDALGLGIEVLRSRKPDVIECALTAFDGPVNSSWSARPGYDPVVQTASGITVRYGSRQDPELHAIASTIDYLTGFLATFGIALSLYKRSKDPGCGSAVKASLAQSAMLAQIPFSYAYHGRKWDEPAGQYTRGPSANSRMYEARDGWVYIHFEPDSVSRLDQLHEFSGIAAADDMVDFLADRIARLSSDDVIGNFKIGGAGAIRVTDLAMIREHYLLHRKDLEPLSTLIKRSFSVIEDQNHESGMTVRTLAPLYARLHNNPLRLGTPNEKHGGSTVSLLKAAGLEEGAITAMLEQGAVVEELSKPYLPG